MGLFMNIVLGIVGAAVASAILSVVGINLAGWIGYLIAGFVGACLLSGSSARSRKHDRLISRVNAEPSARYPCE